jgi:REP element-mobilizing transposase RayT
MFVQLLKQASEMWNIRISAYCMMPNHYHILLQTPDANIARSMRHVNGVYTQRFNRRHDCDGQLFRGRYKSILVSADNYLLQLVRYIHRNPVKAGLAKVPDDYNWTSHKGYLSVAKKWNWLHKEFILSILTKNRKEWIKTYRHFVSLEEDKNIVAAIEGKKWPVVLGTKAFTDWVKGRYYNSKNDDEVPQAKELAPAPELIIKTVSDFYDIERNELYISKRGVFNEPRNAAIYLMRSLRRDSLIAIGELFKMKKYSSVSSIIESTKRRLKKDRKLKERIGNLHRAVLKSQKQT